MYVPCKWFYFINVYTVFLTSDSDDIGDNFVIVFEYVCKVYVYEFVIIFLIRRQIRRIVRLFCAIQCIKGSRCPMNRDFLLAFFINLL